MYRKLLGRFVVGWSTISFRLCKIFESRRLLRRKQEALEEAGNKIP
jgi:hypothetical protein